MSRAIKFRAWDAPGKRWMDEASVYALVKELGIMGHDYGPRYFVEQFSGLHDKNGREIYEGDIVRLKNGDIRTIDWKDGAFWVRSVKHKWNYPIHLDVHGEEHPEVIGNVHENAELLKV